MKTTHYTFLFSLLFFAVGYAKAQSPFENLGNTTLSLQAVLPLPDEGPIPGEAIIAFEYPQSAFQKIRVEDILFRLYAATVEEWSPSGKYALLSTRPQHGDPCGYDGDGNPYGVGRGGGDNNYVAGTDDYDDSSDCSQVELVPGPDGGLLFTADYSDYSPTSGCHDADEIVPNWSSAPINRARIAIIDSGIKGLGGYGMVNGVSVSQKVVPIACTSSVCDSYYPSEAESDGFNSHGRSIASLITAWFRALNLNNKLYINSYKVLNSDLKGSAFQVIKAIEEATADGNHVISLSLGFKIQGCGNGATFVPRYPEVPGVRDFRNNSPLYYAIKDAEDAGVIVVTSAGNGDSDLGEEPQYPAAERGLHNLVTVGALACQSSERASFSNYSNEHVDLFTSGENIDIINNLCLREATGTSFACPIVAAKAGLHITMMGGNQYLRVLCQLRGEARPYWAAKYGIVDTQAPFQSGCSRTVYPKALGKSLAGSSGQKTEAISISPNPFQDQLRIDIPEGEALLIVSDARGARVLQKEVRQPSTVLDLGQLKSGAYWVSVHTATGTQNKAIVKQ